MASSTPNAIDTDNIGDEVRLNETPPPGDAFNDTSEPLAPAPEVISRNSSDVEVIQPNEELQEVDLKFRRQAPSDTTVEASVPQGEGDADAKKKGGAAKPRESSKARLDTKEKGFDDIEETIPLKHTTMLTDKQKAARKKEEDLEIEVISPETIAERERFKQKLFFGIGLATVGAIAIGLFVWYRSRH